MKKEADKIRIVPLNNGTTGWRLLEAKSDEDAIAPCAIVRSLEDVKNDWPELYRVEKKEQVVAVMIELKMMAERGELPRTNFESYLRDFAAFVARRPAPTRVKITLTLD